MHPRPTHVNRSCLFAFWLITVIVLGVGPQPVRADTRTQSGQPQDYDVIAAEVSELLSPVEVAVTSVSGSEVHLAPNKSLRQGLRLRLLRKGTVFLHPVTREPFGEGRRDIGTIVIREVSEAGATALVLEGAPEVGDFARRPESGLRVLLSYDELTHPRVVDQTYAALQKVTRLTVADGGAGEKEERLQYALDRGADAMVYVLTTRTLRTVSLFFTGSNHMPVRTWEAPYTPEPVRFDRGPESSALSDLQWVPFKFPFQGHLIAAGDTDGDGIQDLLIAEGRTVHVFRLEGEGIREMNGFEVAGKGKVFSLGAFAFPGDALASIVVTMLDQVGDTKVIATSQEVSGPLSLRVESRIYRYMETTGYREIWHKDNLFSRASLDGIMVQEFSDGSGYQGPVRRLIRREDGFAITETVEVPKGLNLYDFLILEDTLVSYSPDGNIVIFRPDGGVVWKSDDPFGGGEVTVKLPAFGRGAGREIVRRIPLCRPQVGSRQVFTFRNNPFLGALPGLGFSSVDLRGLSVNPGEAPEEAWKMERVPGRLVDMTVLNDGRLAVLLVPYPHMSDPIFDPVDYVTSRSAVMIIDTRER